VKWCCDDAGGNVERRPSQLPKFGRDRRGQYDLRATAASLARGLGLMVQRAGELGTGTLAVDTEAIALLARAARMGFRYVGYVEG